MKIKLFPSLIFSILIAYPFSIFSQYTLDEYYTQKEKVYEDHVYKAGIKSVRLHPNGADLEMPLVKLRGGRKLLLSFDDLYDDFSNFSYGIEHCNANWTPSGLLTQEYISNMPDGYITEYEYSINTFYAYTHYQVLLPTGSSRFLKSGNYILKVWANDDPSDLVLTKRFMVYEDLVSVSGEVFKPTVVELNQTHQEIRFSINHPQYEIPNPFTDLQVHLMQNTRWDNSITDLKPQFLQNKRLAYSYNRESSFPAGNEFRFFDIKDMRTLSLNVRHVDRDSVITVYLRDHESRVIKNYSTYEDINGQFVIRRLDATSSSSEADYVWVDFFLKSPEPLATGDVYVFGKMSDWKLLRDYRLDYDYNRKAYRGKILMKQGYYNFMYAVYDKDAGIADVGEVEGNKWETENSYQVLVYNREIGQRYDRLIGFGEISSADLY